MVRLGRFGCDLHRRSTPWGSPPINDWSENSKFEILWDARLRNWPGAWVTGRELADWLRDPAACLPEPSRKGAMNPISQCSPLPFLLGLFLKSDFDGG